MEIKEKFEDSEDVISIRKCKDR